MYHLLIVFRYKNYFVLQNASHEILLPFITICMK